MANGSEPVVGLTVADSTPSWDPPRRPPEGAPNVVVIVLDDTGFAQLGCFGSDIETPNIDRLAAGGLRYTNFHTTALCSPTRACLLTGRNHHSVGMRFVSNIDSGFSNCRGVISPKAATMAEVLRDNGYGTFALGKWHLATLEDCSPAGPMDHWPLQRGFDRYYGFMGGATDQFSPELTIDNHPIDPPSHDGYHVSEDIIDQAKAMITAHQSSSPANPFFTYVAFGATHSPHQAPRQYIEKYKGRYDDGWDIVRQRWFDKQIATGVVPEGTTLSPRNPGVDAWDDLSDAQKALYLRMQEAFAGFLDHTDVQIGRLIDFLEESGLLDDTMFVLISDNGASQEGGKHGTLNELAFFNQIRTPVESMLDRVDDIGGRTVYNNYPWGWAQVGNTPLRFYKQNTYEGGIRDPLIIHWP
ncbi:MAG: arylsulfatase, partial [Actinomycetota bacterium]|nr:arylsulfatase [Actinomycetota bacterium]